MGMLQIMLGMAVGEVGSRVQTGDGPAEEEEGQTSEAVRGEGAGRGGVQAGARFHFPARRMQRRRPWMRGRREGERSMGE